MQKLESFVNAKRYFTETFSPERQKVIKDFKRQSEESKREEMILDKGSIFCQNVVLFGGVLFVATQFVAGVPTLKAAGVTTLLVSNAALFLLQIIQNFKIKNIFVNFKRISKEHEKCCSEMKQYLDPLVKDVGVLQEFCPFYQNNSENRIKIVAELEKAGVHVVAWKIDDVYEQRQSEFDNLSKVFK